MYQGDTRKAHNKQTVLNLHQHDTRVDTQRLKTLKTRLLEITNLIPN